ISAHTSRQGTTCSISSRNTCRRVFLVYRSKPFIVARLLCCLFVDLIWRNLLYIPVERETLFRVSLGVMARTASGSRLETKSRSSQTPSLTDRLLCLFNTVLLLFCKHLNLFRYLLLPLLAKAMSIPLSVGLRKTFELAIDFLQHR